MPSRESRTHVLKFLARTPRLSDVDFHKIVSVVFTTDLNTIYLEMLEFSDFIYSD